MTEPIRVNLLKPWFKACLSYWNDSRTRANIYQIIVVATLLLIFVFFISNIQQKLEAQNIASGFSFLEREASFEVSESVISYSPTDSYGRVLTVGAINTLKVALVGNILAVILGILLGISRLSKHPILSRLAALYVDLFRNVPLLLQLVFWYALFADVFPSVTDAFNPFYGVYVSNRGLNVLAAVNWTPYAMAALSFIGILLSFPLWPKRGQFIFFPSLLIAPVLVWLALGAPAEFSIPEKTEFNFEGGLAISPEFLSLLLGLVLYTSAFIAEIVRSGIASVPKGQWEAAKSLGLTDPQSLRLVILPQALRLIVPPLTSQFLNLTKNSSLAIAIGFPDFVAVANTTMNQTGQAIEGIALIMALYLSFSLATSLMMNWYNQRVALVER